MSLTRRATPWNSCTWSGVSALTLNRPRATSISATKGAKFASPLAVSSALSGVRRFSAWAPDGWVIADLLVLGLAVRPCSRAGGVSYVSGRRGRAGAARAGMALADSVTAYVTAALSGAGEWPPEVDREETLDAAAELGRRLLARFQEPAAGGAGLRGPLAYLTSDPESVRARKAV